MLLTSLPPALITQWLINRSLLFISTAGWYVSRKITAVLCVMTWWNHYHLCSMYFIVRVHKLLCIQVTPDNPQTLLWVVSCRTYFLSTVSPHRRKRVSTYQTSSSTELFPLSVSTTHSPSPPLSFPFPRAVTCQRLDCGTWQNEDRWRSSRSTTMASLVWLSPPTANTLSVWETSMTWWSTSGRGRYAS